MEAGHKEKRFFLETTACVCVTNGGEVRGLGVRGKREVEKMSKTSTLCRRLWRRKFEEVKLSLLEI